MFELFLLVMAIAIGHSVLTNLGLIKDSAKTPPATNEPTVPQRLSRDDYHQRIRDWRAKWEPLIDRTKWIPSGTAEAIIEKFPAPVKSTFSLDRLSNGDPALEELKSDFNKHNDVFRAMQKKLLKRLFDSVENNPLTEEQINACICMDRNVEIVAAAGSGKTSTMVAKAGYALHQKMVKGNQILLLAFNRDAAQELRDRVKARLTDFDGADQIKVETFSAFGLHVIATASGEKPSLAPWLEQSGQDVEMMGAIIKDLSDRDPKFQMDWNIFRLVYGRDIGQRGAPSEPDAYENGRRGHRTANGDVVKSKEERLIADWLFYHHVPYEYERVYEHKTATETHRQYQPDFYYPDIQLYHEHFALGADGRAPDHFDGDYVEGAKWKRSMHAEMDTALFETTSHEISTGAALSNLEAELRKREQTIRFDPDREAVGLQPISNKELANTVRIFQQHVKSNGLTPSQMKEAVTSQLKDGHAARILLFIKLYYQISAEWERRLTEGDWIDFEDMLIQAGQYIESGAYQSPFTMVLADEFQDSSRARIRLLKALSAEKDGQVHLCVVGDDWQGINRFAGADISVMTEFEKIFPYASQLTLGTTFRCPQSLCDISSQFIQANPIQIRKTVKTTSTYSNASVLAFGFKDMTRAQGHLREQFDLMRRYIEDERLKPSSGNRITILLLGRYRSDVPSQLKSWQRRFGDVLDISFKTIHSSKGLEADYVMLLNVVEGFRGFPSQIEDDPILQIPMPAPDPYPMAEERRLFYVGLTRAKRQVRIYTSLATPSRFVTELVTKSRLKIEAVDGELQEPCPKCGIGILKLRTGKYGEFESCSTWPRCDFKRNVANTDKATSARH
ncbi:UvrD-helicase domain-containing protein [Mesorhizobium erdmanii]|uniref:UvrD-helicase domain-containing protein n=1 Tax=Mesorhizobium erdmanii TaxID=1777866 RepID=UPI000688A418|nr:UvrD-helicase domain-containing protein [Mesorhizobium erdmanii]